MASFASLPPELVEVIVELAVPPFSPSSWKERARTLKALCLTSKQTLPAARKVLYREVLLSSPDAVVLLARTAEAEQACAISSMMVSGSASGAAAGGPGAAAAFIRLVERAKPTLIRMWRGDKLPANALNGFESLHLHTFYLHGSAYSPFSPSLALSSLQRLQIADTCAREPHLLFTSAYFPNLRSLSVDEESRSYFPGRPLWPLEPHPAVMPVVTQLSSISVACAGDFSASTALAVLEVSSAQAAQHFNLLRLPPSVRVIRLRLLQDATVGDLKACLSQLTRSDISNLLELHLTGVNDTKSALDSPDIVELVEALKKCCEEEEVALVLSSPPDERDPLPSFWRFLDDVKERHGLNV
ncbi:hypothetical protein JCM10213_003161 [Rhodosporidiobolus nylandii]